MLRSVKPGMLVCWDRGFKALDLFARVLTQGGHVLARLPASVKPERLQILPDGSWLVRYGRNLQILTSEDDGRLKMWNAQTEKLLRVLEAAQESDTDVSSGLFAVTSDGRLLAYTYGRDVMLWSMRSGKLLRKLTEPRTVGLAFTSDGNGLFTATSEGRISPWSVRTGKIIQLNTQALFDPSGQN